MDHKDAFHYTYSAKEQAEIKKIRNKYTSPEEDKMELLRRLDASVTQKATAAALVCGILGALILGMGMSLIMSEFSQILGAYEHLAIPIGIAIGLIGTVPICLAYPLYNRIVRKERTRIAPEILRLTDELMK